MSSREQRREAIEKASGRVNSGNGFVQRKDDEKYGRNLQEVYEQVRALPDSEQRVAALRAREEPVTEQLFTLPEAADLAHVEYRTLHNWVKRGLIVPTVRESTGSGVANLLNEEDVARVSLIGCLRSVGLKMSVIETIAASIRSPEADPLALGVLWIASGVQVEYDLQNHRTLIRGTLEKREKAAA